MASGPRSGGEAPNVTATTVMAADVGGTHTRVQLAEIADGIPRAIHEHHYASAAYPDLTSLLRDFLGTTEGHPRYACIAVAGPVSRREEGQSARVTNLPWTFDSRTLAAHLKLSALEIINDFEATGHGIEALQPDDLITLQAGDPQAGAPRAVLGAGTGLGQALLMPCDGRYDVVATEGGHADFAPQTDLQYALLRDLQALHGHVSYERLVSGAGLVRIYEFLHRSAASAVPAYDGDPAAAVSRAGLAGTDALAIEALREFVRIYGAQAGNLALTCLPFGGLFVAGGIAPKILPALLNGDFLQTFNAKGRMEPLLKRIPVHIVIHPAPGLLGAALRAARPILDGIARGR